MRELPRGAHTIPPGAALPRPGRPLTLVESLELAARAATPQDGVGFVDAKEEETWLPWARIWDGARRSGATLRELGLRPGERVALVLGTGPATLDAFFGTLAAGAVPVPIAPPRNRGNLPAYRQRTRAMLEAAAVAAVVTDEGTHTTLGDSLGGTAPRLGLVMAEGLHRGPSAPPVPREMDDLALVQFTSGTTRRGAGLPRPVLLAHRQVLASVDALLDAMPPEDGDAAEGAFEYRGLSWLPLSHQTGLIGAVLTALRRHGPLTLLSPAVFLGRPAAWLRAMSRMRATVSSAPGFAYALAVERVQDADLQGVDLSSWRVGLCGGEPLNPGVLRRFQQRFAPWGLRLEALTPSYGLAEAGPVVTMGDPARPFRSRVFGRAALARGRAEELPQQLGVGAPPRVQDPRQIELTSVGRPLRGFAVEIRGPDGVVEPAGHLGHIWVGGPSLALGYLDALEARTALPGAPPGPPPCPIEHGWLDTGDLGFLHEGDLYVHGRAEDLIVLPTGHHAPQDVESAVDGVPGVRAGCAAAVGERVPDPEGGPGTCRLLLFVELRQARPGLAEACREAVRAATGLDPDLVIPVPAGTLPRTPSGKIRRQATLERWQRGELRAARPTGAWQLAGSMARSAWAYLRGRGRGEG